MKITILFCNFSCCINFLQLLILLLSGQWRPFTLMFSKKRFDILSQSLVLSITKKVISHFLALGQQLLIGQCNKHKLRNRIAYFICQCKNYSWLYSWRLRDTFFDCFSHLFPPFDFQHFSAFYGILSKFLPLFILISQF